MCKLVVKEELSSRSLEAFASSLSCENVVVVEELWDSAKAWVIATMAQARGQSILVIAGDAKEESRLIHDLPFFCSHKILEFPAWETLPSEDVLPSPDIVGERYTALSTLQKSAEPCIVVSTLQACLQKVLVPDVLELLTLSLAVGAEEPFEGVIEKLEFMGYCRTPLAADKGEYAVRGGIIDVFPVSAMAPIRIEFWGDEITSLRIYDPVGQTSQQELEQCTILPAQELQLIRQENSLGDILDYIGRDSLVVFDDVVAIEDHYAMLQKLSHGPSPLFASFEAFLGSCTRSDKLFFCKEKLATLSEVEYSHAPGSANKPVRFSLFSHDFTGIHWFHPFLTLEQLLGEPDETITGRHLLLSLSALVEEGGAIRFLVSDDKEERAFLQKCEEQDIALPPALTIERGYLSSPIALKDGTELLIPYSTLAERHKLHRKKQRSTYHATPFDFSQLSCGDSIVHTQHGLGRFLGIEKRPNLQGVETEYFHLQYASGSAIFVPLSQSHLISKYIGSSDERPVLDVIGGAKWKKARARTEKAVLGFANKLLDVQAQRTIAQGYPYPDDSSEFRAFMDDFPYEETEDQKGAITAVLDDMRSDRPMDRLVCGDVGYGKTEVAMRAAFKAVVDGNKQVAVLVPTTVLALQHYETFCERMSLYPVRIGLLSRFQSTKEAKKLLEQLQEGTIDIVIGTHRIVGKQVAFKDLGLVIVDEEQRFGVRVKEKLRAFKAGVDSLALSATPIPRTLHMSLVGVRDLSTISTPPQDRLPIKSIVTAATDDLLTMAITRELARDGQVYMIHNRVESIYTYAQHVQKLFPHAKIVVGHGQLDAEELDQVFHAFKSGKADILIATSIVENGIDVPNANTILVDRSDYFGLSELYQLRGRVGRWNRRAYAYFLHPPNRQLAEISEQRLQALTEVSGYGGGMKIAMRDLEIRGAGNILGVEQSGHVSSVGFHLYCKLLKRTIAALQGKTKSVMQETKLDFDLDASLPEDYVNEATLRMEFYQRFGEALNEQEVDTAYTEMQDRFGAPPPQAVCLYHMMRLRVFAQNNGFTHLQIAGFSITATRKDGKKKFYVAPTTDLAVFEQSIIKELS